MMMLLVAVICICVQQGLAQYDYAQVLGDSFLFYEAERSGDLDEASNRVTWRGDSALDDNFGGADMAGGWYDAGDHVKFGFPMAFAATAVTWGIIDFKEGYEAAGELTNALNGIRWVMDYFVKCHFSADGFTAQCADGYDDHAFWGRPEDMTMARPCFALEGTDGGSDVLGETAAALAAGSIAFRDTDSAYADLLLQQARELFDLALANPGRYTDHIPAQDFYGSSGFDDELCHGALWLFRATGEQQYMDTALANYNSGPGWAYSWDSKSPACQMLMYIVTGDAQYGGHVEGFLRSWMPGGSVTYTPGGLAWRDTWGSLRYAANSAFIALMADEFGLMPGEAYDWAKGQIDYMLGNNPNGRSYVVGYGTNPPQQPHHRSSSCNPDHSIPCDWDDYNINAPNPSTLYGALVGGPDQNDQYTDSRADYISNEVATDYNGGFTGALAALVA